MGAVRFSGRYPWLLVGRKDPTLRTSAVIEVDAWRHHLHRRRALHPRRICRASLPDIAWPHDLLVLLIALLTVPGPRGGGRGRHASRALLLVGRCGERPPHN